MSMCLFHKWTKWAEYEEQMILIPGRLMPQEQRGKTFNFVESWQKRSCQKCGYVQREKVPTS